MKEGMLSGGSIVEQPEITAKMNIKKVDLYISLKIERKIRIIIAGIL